MGVHPSVSELIRTRLANPSLPGKRTDSYRLALAVEGGAFRGVVSAGMLVGLYERGLSGVFDALYAGSAAATGSAYFISGQITVGIKAYYEWLNRTRFLSRRSILMRKPLFNLDYMFTNVFTRRLPIDFTAFLASPLPLRVLACDATSGQVVGLGPFTNVSDLLDALRASATVPFFASAKPYAYKGQFYWDPLLGDPLGLNTAISEKATHILSLRSSTNDASDRSRISRGARISKLLERQLLTRNLKHTSPALIPTYLNHSQDANTGISRALREGVLVEDIHIAGRNLGKIEHDALKLRLAGEAGRDAACAYLDKLDT